MEDDTVYAGSNDSRRRESPWQRLMIDTWSPLLEFATVCFHYNGSIPYIRRRPSLSGIYCVKGVKQGSII